MITIGFVVASLLVIITPGPDLALISRIVLRHRGRSRASAAALGMVSAAGIQVMLGFSGFLVSIAVFPGVVTVLRWAGATLLFTWALLAWWQVFRSGASHVSVPPEVTQRKAFVQGFLCTGLNPKVGIFLVAFLPQFVPAGAPVLATIALLATLYLCMGFVWLQVWINFMHRISRTVLSARFHKVAEFCTGLVFCVFAVGLVLG